MDELFSQSDRRAIDAHAHQPNQEPGFNALGDYLVCEDERVWDQKIYSDLLALPDKFD